MNLLDSYSLSILKPQRQHIAAQKQFDRVAHGGNFLDCDGRPGRDAHLEQSPPERLFASDCEHAATSPDL